ncbi:hypothetical protein J2128_001437 [Methanomicrobium sp. W14]|uniref:hypothetical protein n=1 Tax=Methanomicrobium sp. W14 TaxID=2817839 RepID=UPI001AE80F6E|nr:hypothetical protein [Methanomicrobium sp. W14]MBP2133483.1 hypothetical protein [Methanomicrobium sp. W14]
MKFGKEGFCRRRSKEKKAGGSGFGSEKFYSTLVDFHLKRFFEERADAVSSVVALMLILAVIATFISIYATTFIPGLKQQSEIEQVEDVKESFIRFSNDIEHITSGKSEGKYSEMIPLGAGDILMSPEKSSGALGVTGLGSMAEIYIDNGTEPVFSFGLVNVSYVPLYTFWEKQGYSWQYGYINATKDEKSTPLMKYTMDDVIKSDFKDFSESLVSFRDEGVYNAVTDKYDLFSLSIDAVNITPGKERFVTGNSVSNLVVSSKTSEKDYVNVTKIEFLFENDTACPAKSEFSGFTLNKTSDFLSSLHADYDNVNSLQVDPGKEGPDKLTLAFGSNVTVSIHSVDITVSAT